MMLTRTLQPPSHHATSVDSNHRAGQSGTLIGQNDVPVEVALESDRRLTGGNDNRDLEKVIFDLSTLEIINFWLSLRVL